MSTIMSLRIGKMFDLYFMTASIAMTAGLYSASLYITIGNGKRDEFLSNGVLPPGVGQHGILESATFS